MSRLVELYRGPSRSLLISYVGVDRCVDSAGAGKTRGFNYVCMTAVPFFSAERAGVADRDVEGPSLMAFRGRLSTEESRCCRRRSGTRGWAPRQLPLPHPFLTGIGVGVWVWL